MVRSHVREFLFFRIMKDKTALVVAVGLAGILNRAWGTAYLSSAFAMVCFFLQLHIRLERRLVSRMA
jgi:hypothetical protein